MKAVAMHFTKNGLRLLVEKQPGNSFSFLGLLTKSIAFLMMMYSSQTLKKD